MIRDIKLHLKFLNRRLKLTEEELSATIEEDPELNEQRRLIESIKGIGKVSASIILAEIPDLTDLRDRRIRRCDTKAPTKRHERIKPYADE